MPETPRSVNAEPDIRAISKSVTLGSKPPLAATSFEVRWADFTDLRCGCANVRFWIPTEVYFTTNVTLTSARLS